MKIIKNLFSRKLAFSPVDPLGDGLREMIRREQRDPNAFSLHDDDFDAGNFWRNMERDLRSGERLDFHE